MTACPDIGTWRAHLDAAPRVENGGAHLAACRECAQTVADLSEAAAVTRAELAVLGRAASSKPTAVIDERSRKPRIGDGRPGVRWSVMRGAAAALLAVVFLATPVGQGVAQAFLDAFRVERFDLVQVTMAQAIEVGDVVASLGTLDVALDQPLIEFEPSTLTAAQSRTGLRLEIPTGVDPEDLEVTVIPATTVRWTFDESRIRATLDEAGTDATIPDGLDGTTIAAHRSDAIVAIAGGGGTEELVLGVSGPVGATSEGLPLDEVRAFLLQLPDIPDGLILQLSAIDDWRTTLPIPVPLDEAVTEVELGGSEAISFFADGVGDGFFWVDGDQVVGVAGSWHGVSAEEMATELISR